MVSVAEAAPKARWRRRMGPTVSYVGTLKFRLYMMPADWNFPIVEVVERTGPVAQQALLSARFGFINQFMQKVRTKFIKIHVPVSTTCFLTVSCHVCCGCTELVPCDVACCELKQSR